MRTTLDLDDELVRRARERAAEQHTTLAAVVERALAREVAGAPELIVLPTSSFRVPDGLNLSDNAAVLDYIDASEATHGTS